MSGLLRLLRDHARAVESDLSRYHQIRYSDRWRFDSNGGRRLTLRELAARVAHLPPESATSRALGGDGWRLEDHLLADIYGATAGQAHPWLPVHETPKDTARDKRRADALVRKHERERAIAAGEIT